VKKYELKPSQDMRSATPLSQSDRKKHIWEIFQVLVRAEIIFYVKFPHVSALEKHKCKWI